MQWLIDLVLESLTGIVVAWSGAIVDIPTGWALCDGTQGTPDLRDRFVVGAGTTYNPSDTGGNVNHSHNFTGDGHLHTLAAGPGVTAGPTWRTQTTSIPATGTTDNANGLPPYYSLAFIMKLPPSV